MKRQRVREERAAAAAIERYFEGGYAATKKRWPDLVDSFENRSILARTKGVTHEDVTSLGKMLNSWQKYQRFCENEGTLSDLGQIPKHALEIITADYGMSIVPHLASVQPIPERVGLIYYKTTKATKSRGNIQAGDILNHPWRPPHASTGDNGTQDSLRYPAGYAGEMVVATVPVVCNGTDRIFAGAPLYEIPASESANVRPRSLRLTGSYTDTGGAVNTVLAVDDGEGNILGRGIYGAVRYIASSSTPGDEAGILSLTFGNIPASGTVSLTMEYATDFEESGYVPETNFTTEAMDISAEIFALTQSQGMFKSFEFENRFGESASEMMAKELTGALNLELGNIAVNRLIAAAENIPGNTATFNAGTPQYITYDGHMAQLKAFIAKADSTILRNAGRGTVNYIIAGHAAAATLSTLPGWKSEIIETQGSNIFGTLDGKVVIRAPHLNNPQAMYCVYKGKGGFDTPLVYAPYMPLVMTNTLQDISNILKNRAIAAVWAGMKVVAPTFVTKIIVSDAVYSTPVQL